jgi:hypothetical protein
VTRDWQDEDILTDFRKLGGLVQAGFGWLRIRFSDVWGGGVIEQTVTDLRFPVKVN